MTRFPLIDYKTHPAFAPYDAEHGYDHGLLETHVHAVDRLHAQLSGERRLRLVDVADCLAEIKTRVDSINAHARDAGAPILAREWLATALDWAATDLRYEYTRLALSGESFAGVSLDASQQEQLHTLRTSGMYVVDLDEREYRTIRKLAMTFLPQLRERLEKQPSARAVYSPSRISALGRAIRRALDEAGVFKVLSVYKANKMRVLGTGLEYSRAQQRWYSGIYSDVGLPESPLQYLHVDETDHLPKAMIYATEVGADNGPTSIVPQSNRWERSELLYRVHKGLDRLTHDRYSRHEVSPYRPAARNPDLRKVFMQLPLAFRGTSHFGDDVLASTDLAADLQSREVRFISATGQAMVFDGPRTLHRGSLVRVGERLAMQVVFKNCNDERINRDLGGGSAARQFLRRVGTKLRLAAKG